MTTIRDLVASIQSELRLADLTPERARVLQQQLSSLLGNCLAEVRAAEDEYRVVLLSHLLHEKKANRARINAEATEEFRRVREAKDTQSLVTEMLRSLRASLRSLSDEMRLAQ